MDHVLVEKEWKIDLLKYRKDTEIKIVKVYCPIEVLEKREEERHNRTLGQAGKQIDIVHEGIPYDFEVDTSIFDPETSAELVMKKFGL